MTEQPKEITELEIKARFTYKKERNARYIAHLDTIDIITKALRRTGLLYAVTSGCHTRPKLTFSSPLPLGHASRCEYFIISLSQSINKQDALNKLNENLPDGIEITNVVCPYARKKSPPNGEKVSYKLWFAKNETAQKALEFINPSAEFTAEAKGKTHVYSLKSALISADIKKEGDAAVIEAQFVQGLKDVPSVSKIITALSAFLGDKREDLYLIERIAVKEINQETNA